MIRAVVDANTVVSGIASLRRGLSPPPVLLRAWRDRRYELVVSDYLLDEIRRTLIKPYFLNQVDPDVHNEMLGALEQLATRVVVTVVVSGIASHPEDDLVLAAAVSAHVDYLVTGDKQLLKLGQYEGVIILSPRDFLARLEQQEDEEATSS